MEHLPNGFTLELCDGAFPLSTDSMVLSHFVRLPKQASVLDLGSGCGTLGLLLCSKDSGCAVTGIELDARAHTTALENIRRNGLDGRMKSICGDLRQVPQQLAPGQFTCCVSNPPYFSGGFASRSLPLARQEGSCTPEDLFRSAAWAVKFGGDFYLVHKPERLAELIAVAAQYKLEAKELCLLRHKDGSPVNLILLRFRKGAKPGLKWEEIILHNSDGSPTGSYREIYHLSDAECKNA